MFGYRIGQKRLSGHQEVEDNSSTDLDEERRLYGLAPVQATAPKLPVREVEKPTPRKALKYAFWIELIIFAPVILGAIAGYLIYGIPHEEWMDKEKDPTQHHQGWARHHHPPKVPHGGQ